VERITTPPPLPLTPSAAGGRPWEETLSEPKGLLVTADGGGSNGYRVRLWKTELQKLADELKFPITVCHLPPGTSK